MNNILFKLNSKLVTELSHGQACLTVSELDAKQTADTCTLTEPVHKNKKHVLRCAAFQTVGYFFRRATGFVLVDC